MVPKKYWGAKLINDWDGDSLYISSDGTGYCWYRGPHQSTSWKRCKESGVLAKFLAGEYKFEKIIYNKCEVAKLFL